MVVVEEVICVSLQRVAGDGDGDGGGGWVFVVSAGDEEVEQDEEQEPMENKVKHIMPQSIEI